MQVDYQGNRVANFPNVIDKTVPSDSFLRLETSSEIMGRARLIARRGGHLLRMESRHEPDTDHRNARSSGKSKCSSKPKQNNSGISLTSVFF